MYADLAISAGAGLPLRGVPALLGIWPMTVPQTGATSAPPEFADILRAIVERRDQASFVTLFDYYAPRVKAYLKRLGATDGLAEDLAQEVMLTVWRKAGSYDATKAGVGTWIFTIARNLRIDSLRRERRPTLDPSDPLISPEPAPLPDAELETVRTEEHVRAALKSLPEDQARVVTMAFYDGKSHGEIAAELAIPLGTVKSRLRLAFRRVRGQLGEHA
ncbi:MAG TPA: sigma-70 family RNA polymerase sigma factor [Stellaceae bacterium]|nr:sigma-70 family RNA polymerase sigma factor [Stellaceae bacterium]